MARPDSSDLDAAIVAKLQNDATLKGLMPDGVYMDTAPAGAKRIVLVGLEDSEDLETYPVTRAREEILYFVKAVGLSSVNPNMKAAARRIDQLLGDQFITPPPAGYVEVHTARAGQELPRIRDDEPDKVDPSIRWLHRGARYWLRAAVADGSPD